LKPVSRRFTKAFVRKSVQITTWIEHPKALSIHLAENLQSVRKEAGMTPKKVVGAGQLTPAATFWRRGKTADAPISSCHSQEE
jgi:hypothetical protein